MTPSELRGRAAGIRERAKSYMEPWLVNQFGADAEALERAASRIEALTAAARRGEATALGMTETDRPDVYEVECGECQATVEMGGKLMLDLIEAGEVKFPHRALCPYRVLAFADA